MLKHLLFLFPFYCFSNLFAQELLEPAGEGIYSMDLAECVPFQQRERIEVMLDKNIQHLKKTNKLPIHWGIKSDEKRKPAGGNFIWPLRNAATLSFNRSYGISNFVDLNPLFPNQVLDWNCGNRTYDLADGYNHAGIDIFLWPFPQYLQENSLVEVIAAADGIVIAIEDGNDDKSCAMSGDQWNAVYIGNMDGTISWYGHLKKNSTTTKVIGEAVTAGEYLGIVGSSGNSTGPHLHFETHFNGEILEPFSGPCNSSPSLWIDQKPYIDPTINAIMTHNHAPIFPNCPEIEIINDADYFVTGDTIFLAAYFSDITNQNLSHYKINGPDNFNSNWTFQSPLNYSPSYYAYWYWVINPSWPNGKYTFEVDYEGDNLTHHFWVNDHSTVTDISNNIRSMSIVPNPTSGTFDLNLDLKIKNQIIKIEVLDITGRIVYHTSLNPQESSKINLTINANSGIHYLKAIDMEGHQKIIPFVVK